jgi:hypothetical protein
MRHLVSRTPWIVIVGVLVCSCGTMPPPLPNVAGLPPDAVAFEYVVERGCLPYLLGETGRDKRLRLQYHPPSPIPDLVEPPRSFWTIGFPVGPRAVLSRGFCSISGSGHDFDTYRAATELALFRKFGASIDDDGRIGYQAVLPGQVTGCRGFVRYTYYPQPHWGGFQLELYRVANCASDPLKING